MSSSATTSVARTWPWPPTSASHSTRSARLNWFTRTGTSSPRPGTASAPPTSPCSGSTSGARDPRTSDRPVPPQGERHRDGDEQPAERGERRGDVDLLVHDREGGRQLGEGAAE